MLTIIVVIAIGTCSWLAAVYGYFVGYKQALVHNVLLNAYLKEYVEGVIGHEEFLRLYTQAKEKADECVKNKTILKP